MLLNLRGFRHSNFADSGFAWIDSHIRLMTDDRAEERSTRDAHHVE